MRGIYFYTLTVTTLIGYLTILGMPALVETVPVLTSLFVYFPGTQVGFISFLGFLVGGLLLGIGHASHKKWMQTENYDKVTMLISILGSSLILYPFTGIFYQIPFIGGTVALLFVFSCLTSFYYWTMTSLGEVLPWLKNKAQYRRRTLKLLDTNVVIDGRVYDIIRTRFLEGNFYVPSFVLEELQYIADSQDILRRQRGRRGLDVLQKLQEEYSLEIGTYDRLVPNDTEDVDSRLVRLAKLLDAQVVTNDFNLNRVASLQEVPVLNINELALSLKPSVMPKERLEVFLIKEGNHPGQAVGYLEDGTMVVVENGRPYVSQTASTIVSQVIQTERGRMIFAEVPEDEGGAPIEENDSVINYRQRRT